MMRDPFELLREANPVAPEQLAVDPVERARMERALAEILTATPVRQPRRRRRHLVAIAVALVALIAAAAAYVVHRAHVTQPLDIGCYASADLRARVVVVSIGTNDDPVAACRSRWQRGVFGTTAVPRLQPCVLPSGAVGVFPADSDDVCQRLGRPAPAATTTTTAEPGSLPADPADLRNSLVARFVDRCLTEREARAIVTDELQRRRMTDWRIVDSEAFTTERPCATLRVDVEQRTVLLIPFVKPA